MSRLHHSYTLGVLLLTWLLLSACSKSNSSSEEETTGLDPYFELQWHLKNSGQVEGVVGEDINVEEVWASGNRGEGVVIAAVDDGLELTHEDLAANILGGLSYNYRDGSNDPTLPSSAHGTCVAGLMAARDDNAKGGVGVASQAQLVGYNLIIGGTTTADIVDAMTRNLDVVSISNNSWGPDDGLGEYSAAETLQDDAIETALLEARSGLGMLIFWAGGNGGDLDGEDNSNYDGMANFVGVNAVCATSSYGEQASYSESGANLLVCSPSLNARGGTIGIVTTDLSGEGEGYNDGTSAGDLDDANYTSAFGGTSAAAPIVSGVAALILAENPNLSWRDVRLILAQSARKNDPSDSDWTTNGAGYPINHKYGFGVVDAAAAVTLARTWTNVGAMVGASADSIGGVAFPIAGVKSVNQAIPNNPSPEAALSSSITVSSSGIDQIEFVQVDVVIDHEDWGDLDIVLKRTGDITTSSQLASTHDCYTSTGQETSCSEPNSDGSWRFGTVRHLGEGADGTWTLEVKDKRDQTSGTLVSWRLKIFGS